MNCRKCGKHLAFNMEEENGICFACTELENKGVSSSPLKTERNNEISSKSLDSGAIKPRYWIGRFCNGIGWSTLVGGILIFLLLATNDDLSFFSTIYLSATIASSALWFGLSEIIRMLQNIYLTKQQNEFMNNIQE